MTMTKLAFSILAAVLVAQVGCAVDGDAIGHGVGIDNTTQALAGGTLAAIDGTYTGCRGRSGAWSVRITGSTAMTNPDLSVVLNDTSCVLTVTGLMNTSGTVMAAAAPMVLGSSYTGSPSAFGGGSFYANAKLSPADFSSDFVVSVIFSDDPGLAMGTITATFQSEVATATAASVPAPSYGIDLTGILLTTDAHNIVYTEAGGAVLTSGAQDGQTYVVVSGGGLSTYTAIDAAYLGAGTPKTIGASIPVADFSLHMVNLTGNQVRTLIVANTVNGIRSYQRFQITFSPAP
jgi:hypothetical protein